MIKVGDTFEVVKIVNSNYIDETLFKLGGFTIGEKHDYSIIKCMGNGSKKINCKISNLFMNSCYLNMRIGTEVKQIGKLTITKVK